MFLSKADDILLVDTQIKKAIRAVSDLYLLLEAFQDLTLN